MLLFTSVLNRQTVHTLYVKLSIQTLSKYFLKFIFTIFIILVILNINYTEKLLDISNGF